MLLATVGSSFQVGVYRMFGFVVVNFQHFHYSLTDGSSSEFFVEKQTYNIENIKGKDRTQF